MIFSPMLRRHLHAPAFALGVIVLTAAVVAVNATAFAAIHALRWRALPYQDGDRLVELQANLRKSSFTFGLAERFRERIAADTAHFDGAIGMPSIPPTSEADDSGRAWRLTRVTTNFASVLGVTPSLGRAFVDADADGETAQVLLLSDAAWRGRFGADPGAIGRPVRIGDRRYTVVGVMPAGFAFPDARSDAWLPLVASAQEREQAAQSSIGALDVVARLARGATVAQARDALEALFAADERVAEVRRNDGLTAEVHPWRERFAKSGWQALTLLQFVAAALLAIVAANLAGLMLDRLLARVRELDIRRALGAGDGVIAAGIAADLAVPACVGAAIGLAAVPAGLHLLERRGLLPANLPQGSGLGFAAVAAGIAVVALIAITVLAAAFAARDSLRISNRVGHSGLGRLRSGLVVGQIMLTTALSGGVALLVHSAIELLGADRGFDDTGVLVTSIDPRGKADDTRRTAIEVENLRAGIAALPGVERAAFAEIPPFSGSDRTTKFRASGTADEERARDRSVGTGYFETLGIGLVAGRTFELSDHGDDTLVVVDERYRQRHLHGADPLPATVELPDDEGRLRPARIVGVVRSVKNRSLDENDELPTIYHRYVPSQPFYLLTRSALDAGALAPVIRQRVLAQFPDAWIGFNAPLRDLVVRTLDDRRHLLEAIGALATATLLLAALGLAAVLGFAIRRRTAELGVRLALGATPSRVRNLVLRQGGALIGAGLVLGALLGIACARLLADRLFGIGFTDPASWAAALALVAAIALFACWLPARRAAATDPVEALRHE